MISVVVCTHNGSTRIGSCISFLIAQKNPPEYEILVVDNASTDGTSDLVKSQLESSFPTDSWRVIQEKKEGLLHARMSGIQAAKYDWVLFCDDDNLLFPDFLFLCKDILNENSKIGVLGSIGIPEFLGPKPDWFDQYASSYAVGPQVVDFTREDRLVHVYGACSVYRKEPLLELFQKGFKPALSDRTGKELISGGDVEWCWLMQLMGFKIAYSPNLKFYHQLPASRLTWDYYLRLKRGISSSSGLLCTYTFYFSTSFRPLIMFQLYYLYISGKSMLLYLKNWLHWNGKPSRPKDELSYAILESQMKAYFNQRKSAIIHFRQLKDYFGY